MDYRRFLGREESLVLPWLGGDEVVAKDRALRLEAPPPSPGWYRFRVHGRRATAVGEAAPELAGLPAVRGHLWGDQLVTEGARVESLHLLSEEEPPRLSPVLARRWHSEELLFEGLELEGDAEEPARRALEEGRGAGDVRHMPATLRAAFCFAVFEGQSQVLGVPARPVELRPHLQAAAEGGAAGAAQVLQRLAEERRLAARHAQERLRLHAQVAAQAEVEALREARQKQAQRAQQDAHARAEAALAAAGARLVGTRRLGGGQLEVIFTFLSERFGAIVDVGSLQVLDSGICLGHPGHDRELTLDSLPAVIREAVQTGQLVILRHV